MPSFPKSVEWFNLWYDAAFQLTRYGCPPEQPERIQDDQWQPIFTANSG